MESTICAPDLLTPHFSWGLACTGAFAVACVWVPVSCVVSLGQVQEAGRCVSTGWYVGSHFQCKRQGLSPDTHFLIDYSFSLGLRLVCFSPCTCWKAELCPQTGPKTTLWRPASSGRWAKQIQQWGFAASLVSPFLTSQPWQCRASACSSCCLILLPVAWANHHPQRVKLVAFALLILAKSNLGFLVGKMMVKCWLLLTLA